MKSRRGEKETQFLMYMASQNVVLKFCISSTLQRFVFFKKSSLRTRTNLLDHLGCTSTKAPTRLISFLLPHPHSPFVNCVSSFTNRVSNIKSRLGVFHAIRSKAHEKEANKGSLFSPSSARFVIHFRPI